MLQRRGAELQLSKGVKHCGLGGHDRRVGERLRARAPSAKVPCGAGGGGGDRATDQAPETRRPNAAQSVVPGVLRAHTRETVFPFPWGGGGPCRKWSRRSASPPIPCPWGGIRLRDGRGCMHVVRTRGQGEETKRRAAAMMLSRTGWGETPLPVAYQTAEGRRAPWGCAAGAPYRGTASPPPPPLDMAYACFLTTFLAPFLFCGSPTCVCMCVCVCVCVCVSL